ncbi:MAG: septation protein SepH, partial [Nocardioides sp.]
SAVSESTQHEELPLDSPTSDPTLGDDAIEMVTEESASLGAEQPVEAYLDDERSTRATPAVEEPAVEPAAEAEPSPEPAAEEEPPARKVAKRKGRASVPSWDEIMFGGGKND